ncbi:MAG: two-component sensor histidine kinase [Clostridium sp.]|nr:two-component sensor histidine kinase [Clostridium sp.]
MSTTGRSWMRHISMKLPLVLCFLLVTFVPLAIQTRALSGYFRQEVIAQNRIEAQNRCLILANEMTDAEYMKNYQDQARVSGLNAELNSTADIFGGRLVVVDKNFRIVRDSFKLSEGRTIVVEEVLKAFGGQPQYHLNDTKEFYYVAYPISEKQVGESTENDPSVSGILLMTVSTEKLSQIPQAVMEKTGLLQMMLLLAAAALDIVFAVLLMRPFRNLQNQLKVVSEGNLDQKIDVHTYAETSDISDTVNRTIDTLRTVDQSRQEFVSNVSHELKTPITSIRVLADSLMGMDNPPVELYQEFMEDISREIDREAKIIDDLLTLVRMDRSSPDLTITSVSVNALVEDVLRRLRPIARKRNIELSYESIREVRADLDEVKFTLAVTNLVENAIKYNREEGWVRVSLDADHKFFYIEVSDNGIGIPTEFQPHVFERFYRVDKARSRESGGTGLGLAITRNIILLHHGAIRLKSEEGTGTTFTVRIPLNYIDMSAQ